jgi:hypothetical protein
VEVFFGLLLIVGIFKLLGWLLSPLLDKIENAVHLIRQNELDEAIKEDAKRDSDALFAKLQASEVEWAIKEQARSAKLMEEQRNIEIEKNPAPVNVKEDEQKPKTNKQFEEKKFQEESIKPTEVDPLKAKGDKYERYIGKRFEDKGDLVIYNGFIRGFEDGGVDIATLSTDAKTINLVQCKHWSLKALEFDHIKNIYEKLNTHNFDFLRLRADQIAEHLSARKQNHEIEELLTIVQKNKKNLQIRKTLYISSDKVVDLEIGKHLTMIQSNIFRYQDMKIVVERI